MLKWENERMWRQAGPGWATQLSPILILLPRTADQAASYLPGSAYRSSCWRRPHKVFCLSLVWPHPEEDTLYHRTDANASLPPTWQVSKLQLAWRMHWPAIGKGAGKTEKQEACLQHLCLPFLDPFPNLAIFFFLHCPTLLLILLPNPENCSVPLGPSDLHLPSKLSLLGEGLINSYETKMTGKASWVITSDGCGWFY